MIMNEKIICKQAVEIFGEKLQADMAIEECAELIIAIRHYDRGSTCIIS